MRVLFSLLRFVPNRAYGGHVYIESLLRALDRVVGPQDEVYIACSKQTAKWCKSVTHILKILPMFIPSKAFLSIIYEGPLISQAIKKLNPDVVFFPFNLMPKVSVPSLLMVHDLMSFFYGRRFPMVRRYFFIGFSWLLTKSIGRATKISTPTEAIADEIAFLGLRRSVDIFPIREAVSERVNESPECLTNISFLGVEMVCLQTGTNAPHKGQAVGLEAMASIKKLAPDLYRKISLIVTGDVVPELVEKARTLRIENHVAFPGRVSRRQLNWLLEKTTISLFPTYYEGFGLGLIESQYAGKAIVASDLPVLREVTGGHAVFFPTGDHVAMAKSILWLLQNERQRCQIESAGIRNALRWTWDDYARKLIKSLRYTAKL